MSKTKLSNELLARLLDSLDAQGAPVLTHLNPGLSDTEIDQLTNRIGIQLPDEPRTWWKWHDGTSLGNGDIPAAQASAIGPLLRPLTLAEAISVRADELEIAADVEPENADYWWNPAWLPFTGARIAIDVTPSSDGCCAVRNTDPMWDPNDRGPIVMESMGELIELWIHALDNRIWYWDPEASGHGAWFQDHDLVTPELRRTSQF